MKWRLAIAFLSFTFAILLVQDLPLVSYFSSVEESRITTSLERDSFMLATKSHDAFESQNPDEVGSLQDVLDRYQLTKSGTHIMVSDADGIVLADTNIPGRTGENISDLPGIAEALSGTIANGRTVATPDEPALLYVAIPIMDDNQVLGAIINTYPVSMISSTVNKQLGIFATIAGLSLALAAIMAVWLARTITRPIEQLEVTTMQLARGDLSTRVDATRGDPEIQSLGTSFNKMADQLARLIEQQRAFAADASHQLRTPLTALHLRLENALEIIEDEPHEGRIRVEAALDEAERLQMIIEGLLALSRADVNRYPETQSIDLVSVARDRVDSWAALAEDAGIKVELRAPASALVLAVPNALEQVIDNYVDNALMISPRGSTVTVLVERGPSTTVLHVLDEGPGLPEQDLERAFNRFWRARSDSTGSGLGLAIVERLVSVSGGKVRLENRKPHGLDAQAELTNA